MKFICTVREKKTENWSLKRKNNIDKKNVYSCGYKFGSLHFSGNGPIYCSFRVYFDSKTSSIRFLFYQLLEL